MGHIEMCPGCERLEQERENANQMPLRGLKVGLVPKAFATSGEELGG